MEYIAADGTVLTDEAIEEMAKEYEEGTWTVDPSTPVWFGMTEEELEERAKGYEEESWAADSSSPAIHGRPCLYGEKMVTVSFRVPAYLKDTIDSTIERSDISRSQFFRNAICREILRCQMHELYGQEEDNEGMPCDTHGQDGPETSAARHAGDEALTRGTAAECAGDGEPMEESAAGASEFEAKSEKRLVQEQVRAMLSSKGGDKAAA